AWTNSVVDWTGQHASSKSKAGRGCCNTLAHVRPVGIGAAARSRTDRSATNAAPVQVRPQAPNGLASEVVHFISDDHLSAACRSNGIRSAIPRVRQRGLKERLVWDL